MNTRLDMLSWHVASIKFSQVFNYFLPIHHNEEYSFVLDSYEVTGEKRIKKGKRHALYEKTIKDVWEDLNFAIFWQLSFSFFPSIKNHFNPSVLKMTFIFFPYQTKPENSKHLVHKFIFLFILNST